MRFRPEQFDPEFRPMLAKKADHEWTANLPPAADYRIRHEMVATPADVKPGFYFLIASQKANFEEANNQLMVTDVWVSTLALVMNQRQGDEQISGFVLDASSGDPIDGAEVQPFYRPNRDQSVVKGPPVKTDANGKFSVPGRPNERCQLLVRFKDQQLASSQDHYVFPGQVVQASTQTIFFTDRSIYRPGQTVQYKGICLRVDQAKDDYATLANQKMTIVFSDQNNKEIARQEVKSNDYGSFSGSFTAPRDRLLGQMSIRTEGGPPGATMVSVEEYKRPKFQVTLDRPRESPKLNDKVRLDGKAMAYTGAAIDNAAVRYRVVRQVRYPIWWGWFYSYRMPGQQGASQEIARGTALTRSDGSFSIEFLAKPDLSVPESDEPTFVYTVHADVKIGRAHV